MRATSSGERTAFEAAGSGFAVAAALTIGDGTITDSPGCEDIIESDSLLAAALDTGAEETRKDERAAAKLLLVFLAVMMARTNIRKCKRQNKCTVRRWKQTAQPHTAGTYNTCDSRNPVCHIEAHDLLTTADQHWLDFNLA